MTRFVFTIGGVLSGLGKGITTASLGLILKQKGFSVTAVKIDPYISLDAGTMRPTEHGETFVTADGGEIDQDLGNYERFLEVNLSKRHNITTGKVYQAVIDNERAFKYGGRDAELIPDIINEIKDKIYACAKGFDICLVEVGGTTGDLENMPFLYAAREIGREHEAAYILLTYLPFLRNVGELKTKPTQHAVAALRATGIFPDFIITRNEIPLDKPRAETISKRCFVDLDRIIDNPDTDSIYNIPLLFEKEKLADTLIHQFHLRKRVTNIKPWKKFVKNLQYPKKTIRIGMVGKYFRSGNSNHKDVYVSVNEALMHAGGFLGFKPEIVSIDSSTLGKRTDSIMKKLHLDALIAPQGWGSRDTEGIISAIHFARVNKIPYLGLCFGMQLAVAEFARNVCGMSSANSTEVDQDTSYPVIHIMPDQQKYLDENHYGGTIRLGAWPCLLTPSSLIDACYKKYQPAYIAGKPIHERHRHRFEFNNDYRDQLTAKGLIISGTSPDGKLVEAIELPKTVHPFFVATQFHPEYQSRVLTPHPLFIALLHAAA